MQVRKIDFAKLDRLTTRADAELRETEDALISFIEAQEKRDRLYMRSQGDPRRWVDRSSGDQGVGFIAGRFSGITHPCVLPSVRLGAIRPARKVRA